MIPEENQSKLFEFDQWLIETRAIQDRTNRIIEAIAKQGLETKQKLAKLSEIVTEFVQATNNRLTGLERN